MMTESMQPKRHNTFIDIPDSLRLPHFMMLDDIRIKESSELNTDFKLVLQSVVCHRGDSLHSGHYVTFARVNPKLLTDNRRQDHDPPPDYEEAQWVKFDDLLLENRVSHVDDIRQSLRDEMPYLLFYQILPMVDVTRASTDEGHEPPSYNDSTVNVTGTHTPNPDLDHSAVSRRTSGYFDSTTFTNSTGPSIRFSAELERPPRISLDDDANAHLKASTSRRGSLTFSEAAAAATPALTPEGHSPAATPGDESTAGRLTRAAARFTKTGSRSRPVSQPGDNRISATMSRLGLVRPSKEPLLETDDGAGEPSAVAPAPADAAQVDQGLVIDGTHHHPHHHHGKKSKSKTREKDADKGKEKAKGKTGVPERECLVM